MGSVFEGVPALQMPPDYSNILQSLSDGLEQRRARQKQNEKELLAQTIGSKLATGDYKGAEGAAFGAGDVPTGLKVHELSLADKKQFGEMVQRYTILADTPEKWDALRGKLTQITGQDPGDFETGRPALQGEFGNLDTILQANNQAADNSRADQSLEIQKQELELKKLEAASGGKPPSGYIRTPDGGTTFEPGGPADPAMIAAQAAARVSAGTKTAKPTDREARNAQLYKVSKPELDTVEKTFPALSNVMNQAGANVGNFAVSSDYQQARSSVSTIVASYLYSVSGATANPGEVATQTDILMPKFGDGKAVIADKLQRIRTMVDSIKSSDVIAGPAKTAGDPADENNPPAGIDPEDWRFLTPEERQQYIDAGN